MNLASKTIIKNLLKQRGLRPSRRLGQNFLIDKGAVQKIIDAADLEPGDVVLEIGPGIGTLTQELAKKAKRVVAVEKDGKMVEILGETLKDFKNIEIIRGDIRFLISEIRRRLPPEGKRRTPSGGVRISEIKKSNYKVVGNLPFYLTAPVIRQFLEHSDVARPNVMCSAKPSTMTLVVQKEVGQRICQKPPRMSLLAVSVQFYAEPKIISYISKKSFWPSPEVNAAILKITPNVVKKATIVGKVTTFFRIVRAGFSQPRKQLINNLSKGLKIDKKKVGEWLLRNNIRPTQRAETLSVEDWQDLTFSANMLK